MIILILLSCCIVMLSAVPVFPPLLSQGGATQAQRAEAMSLTPDAQTPALLSPEVEQPQPGATQQLGPQGGPQFLPPTQHYTWSPLGGSSKIMLLQPSVHGPQPANQPTLPQQPLIFSPYGYFPLFSPSYRNQLFSPYGFPMILESPRPQTPANQPQPAETPSEVGPLGDPPQQQQQNPQIVYMLQQSMSSQLGSLSSEELEMAAKMGQLGAYLPAVLANLPAGAVQHVSQAAGLANTDKQGIVPTAATSSAPRTQQLASSGPQPNTDGIPVGLERPAQREATTQTPVRSTLQTTQPTVV